MTRKAGKRNRGVTRRGGGWKNWLGLRSSSTRQAEQVQRMAALQREARNAEDAAALAAAGPAAAAAGPRTLQKRSWFGSTPVYFNPNPQRNAWVKRIMNAEQIARNAQRGQRRAPVENPYREAELMEQYERTMKKGRNSAVQQLALPTPTQVIFNNGHGMTSATSRHILKRKVALSGRKSTEAQCEAKILNFQQRNPSTLYFLQLYMLHNFNERMGGADPTVDALQYFSGQILLNTNWKKIDIFIGAPNNISRDNMEHVFFAKAYNMESFLQAGPVRFSDYEQDTYLCFQNVMSKYFNIEKRRNEIASIVAMELFPDDDTILMINDKIEGIIPNGPLGLLYNLELSELALQAGSTRDIVKAVNAANKAIYTTQEARGERAAVSATQGAVAAARASVATARAAAAARVPGTGVLVQALLAQMRMVQGAAELLEQRAREVVDAGLEAKTTARDLAKEAAKRLMVAFNKLERITDRIVATRAAAAAAAAAGPAAGPAVLPAAALPAGPAMTKDQARQSIQNSLPDLEQCAIAAADRIHVGLGERPCIAADHCYEQSNDPTIPSCFLSKSQVFTDYINDNFMNIDQVERAKRILLAEYPELWPTAEGGRRSRRKAPKRKTRKPRRR